MNLTIDQNNVHLLLPGKMSRMAEMYIDDHESASVVDALRALYRSRMYAELERESTKLWEYGPVALYEIVCEEEGASLSGQTP